MVHDDTNSMTIVTRFLLVSSRLLRTGGEAGVLSCLSKAHGFQIASDVWESKVQTRT